MAAGASLAVTALSAARAGAAVHSMAAKPAAAANCNIKWEWLAIGLHLSIRMSVETQLRSGLSGSVYQLNE